MIQPFFVGIRNLYTIHVMILRRKRLKTERLIIREFNKSEEDLAGLLAIMSDVDVNQYLPWFPLISKEDASVFFNQNILPKYETHGGYYFAICLKEDNLPIGYITVSGDESHDFGYGVRKEFWSTGIVTEAAKCVIDYLKKQGWLYITATHDVNNIGSGKVMEKLGMTYKYSYREQWQPKNISVVFRMYQINFDEVDRTYDQYWHIYEEHFIENL